MAGRKRSRKPAPFRPNEIIVVKLLSNEFMKRYTVESRFNNRTLLCSSLLLHSKFSLACSSRPVEGVREGGRDGAGTRERQRVGKMVKGGKCW